MHLLQLKVRFLVDKNGTLSFIIHIESEEKEQESKADEIEQ